MTGVRHWLPVRILEPGKDPTVDMWCSYVGDRCEMVGFLCDDGPSRKRILRDKDHLYGDGTRYLIVLNPNKHILTSSTGDKSP